ncbi:MAG: YlxR family protein [Actinobacteria bacterium]|nr:YlxR family protein [Actinomycetota bacterium]
MASPVRKVPIRTCIACRRTSEKGDLVRIVRTPDTGVLIDEQGKMRGRGAYICSSMECFEDVRRRRKLNAALKVALLDDDYERLQRDFKNLVDKTDV